MYHLGYFLVSLIFGTTIPTSFNILMKCFLHLFICDICIVLYYMRQMWNHVFYCYLYYTNKNPALSGIIVPFSVVCTCMHLTYRP